MRALRQAGLYCVVALVGACLATVDLPGVGSGAGGGGGGAGEGGAGGSAGEGAMGGEAGLGGVGGEGGVGGAGGLALPDWTKSFEAAFLFNDASAIAKDETGNHTDFIDVNTPAIDTDVHIEGRSSLAVDQSAQNGLLRPVGELPLESYTVGGWFYVKGTPPSDIAFVYTDATFGYALEYENSTVHPRCYHGDANGVHMAEASVPWPFDAWIHVACRYDANTEVLTIFANGVAYDSFPGALPIAYQVTPMQIPDPEQPYTGYMDELFFHAAALDSASIFRIWACGIKGADCQCDPDDPTSYLDCGPRTMSCGLLPPCNQANP